jgi:hypothetical protein
MVPLYSKNDGTYVTQVKIEELNGDRKVPKVSIDVIGLQKIGKKNMCMFKLYSINNIGCRLKTIFKSM